MFLFFRTFEEYNSIKKYSRIIHNPFCLGIINVKIFLVFSLLQADNSGV